MQIFSTILGNRRTPVNSDNFSSAPRYEAGPCLSESLYLERRGLEAQLNRPNCAPTETLRLALRRYRALSRRSCLYVD